MSRINRSSYIKHSLTTPLGDLNVKRFGLNFTSKKCRFGKLLSISQSLKPLARKETLFSFKRKKGYTHERAMY